MTLDRASIQPSQRRRRVATEPLHRVWRPGDVHVSQGRRVVRVVIHAGTERLPSIARAAPVLAVVAAVVAAAVAAVVVVVAVAAAAAAAVVVVVFKYTNVLMHAHDGKNF